LVEVKDAVTGQLIRAEKFRNLVVNTGLNLLRDMIGADTRKAPTHLWIGTNATAVAAGDTAATITAPFKKEITARVPASFNISLQTFIGTTEANGVTYKEAGLVNSRGSIDTLFSRVRITDIVKTSSVTVTFTWTITVAAA